MASGNDRLLPAAYGLAMEKGLTVTGPPFVRYVGEIDAPDLFASSPAPVDWKMQIVWPLAS